MSLPSGTLKLHGWYKSSCSARVRIALAHKCIDFTPVYVSYDDRQHHGDEYAAMNPSRSVPTLEVVPPDGSNGLVRYIAQSVAALEYLEEAYPSSVPLLPPPADVFGRAEVRSLVQIVVSDVQPLTNTRVFGRVVPLGQDETAWGAVWHARGLKAYEESIREGAGRYSVGDGVTMADVCLAPMIWNAFKWGLTLDEYPTVKRVYDGLMELEAFREGHWSRQPDCPPEQRSK